MAALRQGRGGDEPVHELPPAAAIVDIVRECAHQLLPRPVRRSVTGTKDDGSLVTEADLQIQRHMSRALAAHWPQYALMGEEMEHREHARLMATATEGLWCLDPLDGTTNFSSGFPFYGISLALLRGGQSVLAVVYDPVREECFHATRGGGAYLNGEALRIGTVPPLRECIANVDYKRLVARLSERLVRSPPYRSQRNLGSSVLEWCWLAAGRFHLYLHGGQKLWDYAAGSLVLAEAGGRACSIDGGEIDCRSLSKRSVVAAASPALLAGWSAWVQQNVRARR